MLTRWLKQWRSKREEARRIATLAAAIAMPLQDQDLDLVYPTILPVEALPTWPGPIMPIAQTPFALAWAEVREANAFVYVTHAIAEHWEANGVDWRRTAFDNLRRISEPGANGEKAGSDGRPFIKVMLQPDALGPSRLLIPGLFTKELGDGCRVAIPERTCGIAYRNHLASPESDDVDDMIGGCFEHGTEPMSSQRFDASLLWQPALSSGW